MGTSRVARTSSVKARVRSRLPSRSWLSSPAVSRDAGPRARRLTALVAYTVDGRFAFRLCAELPDLRQRVEFLDRLVPLTAATPLLACGLEEAYLAAHARLPLPAQRLLTVRACFRIPNARQRKTSFPLVMDEQTFLTWGALLGHMDKLLRGRTLLGGTVASPEARNLRDLSMGVCEPGEGLDVQSLWTDPVRSPMSPDSLKSRCRKPSAARPLTGLAAMIAESARRNAGRSPESFSGEWMILRHFYWVN